MQSLTDLQPAEPMNGKPLDLVERLKRLAEALPADGSVTFSRSDLERLTGLRAEEEPTEAGEPIADLTVDEVAEAMGKSPNTVRGWAPNIPGAYKLGREWRFPRTAVRAWLDSKKDGDRKASREPEAVDLSSWRHHVNRKAS